MTDLPRKVLITWKSITERQDGRNFKSVRAICNLYSCCDSALMSQLRIGVIWECTRFQPIRNAQFFNVHNISIYWDREKNKETILSSLQACFVVTHLSGDFIVKNIRNHRCIYNLQICIIGVAVNLNVSFNCYAVTLCFYDGMRTRVHYVYWVMIIQVGRWWVIFLWGRGYIS